MKRLMICAAFAASALLGGATAAAAEDGQMRVKLADLNMDTDAGAKVALARIQQSAGVFCEDGPVRKRLETQMRVEKCVADMTQKSVDQLHAPRVTALLRGPAAPLALAQK